MEQDSKLLRFYNKIHEISIFQLNKLKCLMDYGFYFRDIDNAYKLKQQKKYILEQANNIIDKEENLQEYLKQRWKICKGLFAVKYLEIHLELDNKFPENRYQNLPKKDQLQQHPLRNTEEIYISKLEKCLNKFLEYREQVTDEEIKTEILMLDLVVLLFKIRLGIRKQNLPEIMALFDDYQMFIKEMMSFQHYGWIIIQSILIIFGMCRYQTEDFKGSAILFRKVIKLSTIMIQSDYFLETFFSNPEKRMKLQIIIYDCEILLSKAIFEMTKCLKESIQLEQIILKIDSDVYLNAEQKQEIFEKFKKQYEKQRTKIIKNGGQTKNTDSELGSVSHDKQFQRKDSQLNFQKLAQEVSQKSNKFQQQSNSSQKKKIAFLISQKNNEKWFKNAMQSNNIQNNTPVFHQNSKQSLSRGTTQSLSRGGSIVNQSPTSKKENPLFLQIPQQNNQQLNNSFSKQVKPQVKSMLLQTVTKIMAKKKSFMQPPANLEVQSLNPNLAARRSMARQSILVGNSNIKQYLANVDSNKNSPSGNVNQREGPYEIDDEDIENLGNNLSELSITLPHDNQSFIDRFNDQQKDDLKYEKIRQLNFQNNINVQKDVLIERINLFKKLKGGVKLFPDYNLEDQIQDKQRLEIEQSLGKEVKERFKQNLVPIYKEIQQQQSKQPSEQNIEQSQQSQQFQIKIVPQHKKAKSMMQFSDAQHFSSTQLSMNPQQQPKNNYKSSQQIKSQEKLNQNNLSQENKIKSMTSLKGHHHHRVQSAQLHSGSKTQNNLFQYNQYQQTNNNTQKLQQNFQHQLAIPLQIQINNLNQNPYYCQSVQISPQSNKNLNKQSIQNISILSPQNKNSISMSKTNIQNYQNFMKTSQEQKISFSKQQNASASKQSIMNQFNSPSSKKQIKQSSPLTSMELIQDTHNNAGQKQQKNSLSNIHSPEMSSFSTERTNDSRVYRSATGKNSKKLSNIIGIDQANSIMNARPKWDLSSASSTKYEEFSNQKMKKPNSTLNLIDQIIGQSQIIMENQYANPSDIHTPFPFIQYALKNVEKERILQQLIQKSQTNGFVQDNQKNFVKEIVFKKRTTPKHLEQDDVEKLQQNIRREILNQQSKIEEEITKTDIDKIEESFNKYLFDKQKSISKELEQERERLKAQETLGQVQNELKNSKSININNLKKQQSIQDDSIKISTHFQNQSKNEISNQGSIVGEEKFLEIQDLNRKQKQKKDEVELKDLMDTEESQEVLYQIEQSNYSNNQSEYLDRVDILEENDEIMSESSRELTHKKTKKQPISMIFQENNDNDAFVSENILKQFENMKKKKFSGLDSLENLSDEEKNLNNQKSAKFPIFEELQSSMAKGKIKIRKQKALSQSQIQYILNEDQKATFQIIDEDNKQVNLEKNHPSFEFTFYNPFKIDKIKIQLKAISNQDKTFTYLLTFLGQFINDSMKIDFNFSGNPNVKNLMDQYTIWPLVLESIKKQLAFEGFEEMISDKTMYDGQYLITDQNIQKLEEQDQTLNDLHEWKEKLARANIGSQSLAQKKLKGHSQSENIQFTRDGQARVLKRQSTYFMRTKYKMNYFCDLDKDELKFLNEKDIKSIGSIKNLLNTYFLSCYEHNFKISGKQMIRKVEQEDINFIQAQKTIHQIFNQQKKISRMQARECIIPYICDKVEPGTSLRIIMYKKENDSKVNTSNSQRSVSLLDQSLVLTKREKQYLSYWKNKQKALIQKEKDLKVKLSDFLVQKRDDVIFYLTKKLQQKSYIGTLIKKQYLFNSYFYIHIYLSHNKIKDINLYQTIDMYCKIKELPFIILVDAFNIETHEKIIPLELPIENLIGIFPRDEILNSITQLLLTGQMQKNFKRKLIPYIEEKIFIMLSTNNQRQRTDFYSLKSSQAQQTKQQKVAFQTTKFDEFNQLHLDPSLIYQDLPRIFSEKIKQQIEPTIYEKLFENLFNEVYEKDFINRRNVDVDAIFQNINQQNNILKQNALKEGEIEMQNQEQNTQQQMLSLNNSFTNTNLIDQASNLDESLQYQFGTNNLDEIDKYNPTFSQNPISRKQLTQLSNNYSNLINNNKFLFITKNVKNELKQLEKHRKKIIKNIKLIQDIQNNILAQPNISINNISIDSSFVSTNNLQGSFYQNDQNIQLNNIQKHEQVLDRLYRQLKKADYQMDWQVYGLFGRFLIYVNEFGKVIFKINNFLPKLELTFDQITNKQQNIIINILSYAVNLRFEEQKAIQNTKTMLRYMLQNIVQKDFRSLTSFRFYPRKPTEFGTQQLILSNNSSVQYHLNLQTKEFLSQYSNIKQTFAYGLKNIGRSLVVGFSFTSNLDMSSSKYQILLSLNIMPLLSKTIMYKTILSLQDLSMLDPQNSIRIISSKMASSTVLSTFKSILKKSIFINTQIGRLPVFHYSQTTYLFQLNTPSTSKRLFKTQVYEGKKLSGIYSRNNQRLRSLQNNQNFEEASEAAFNSSIQGDEEMFQWNNHLNQLRVFRNSMIKLNFDQKVAEKQTQNFLNEDIIRYRFIFSTSKIFQNEYILVSVFRDLLQQNWLIKFYFPRNCRYLQCHLDSSDLFQSSSKFLKKTISNQILWLSHENEYQDIFQSYLDFQKRLNLKGLLDSSQVEQQNETFIQSPVFLNKKRGTLHLSKHDLKKFSIIQASNNANNQQNERKNMSFVFQKSPFSSRSPSPTKRNEISPNSYKNEYQQSPLGNNVILSKFFVEKKAAETVKNKNNKSKMRSSTQKSQKKSIIQNEPTVDSQYDMTSKSIGVKTGGFQDYLRSYIQTERQIPLKKRQLSGIFNGSNGSFNNIGSERVLNVKPNDFNNSFNEENEILKNRSINNLPYIIPSNSSLEQNENKQVYQAKANSYLKEKQNNQSQNLIRSKMEKIQTTQENQQTESRSGELKQTSQKSINNSQHSKEKEEQQENVAQKKKNLRDIVHKHLKSVKIINSVKSIVEYLKPKRNDKINRIERLKNMTLFQDQSFIDMIKQFDMSKNIRLRKQQQHLKLKQEKNDRYYEIKIWENIINHSNLRLTCLQLDLGGEGINLKEILISKYLRVDKTSENFFEISIDLLEVLQQKNMQIQMQNNGGQNQDFEINFKNIVTQHIEQQLNQKAKKKQEALQEEIKEEQLKNNQSSKKDITKDYKEQTLRKIRENPNRSMTFVKNSTGIDYFCPIEYIQYAATSAFNFTISHMNLNQATFQDIYLNCREITNVFIAEGYFKYQANYIYSNINYADFCNLAQFILYKICNSNFLEMLYDKSEQKRIKKEDLNRFKVNNIPKKYNKKNIRFINPQNIQFMHTKIVNPFKRTYIRTLISTHDMTFNLEMFQISTKNSIKITKSFVKMIKKIPFLRQHFEMGEIFYVLKHITEYYEQQLTIAWSLKYV